MAAFPNIDRPLGVVLRRWVIRQFAANIGHPTAGPKPLAKRSMVGFPFVDDVIE
jgi:hypothetical protein